MEVAKKDDLKTKVLGLVLISIGVYWTYRFLWFFYAYNSTEVLYALILPDHVLVMNIIIGMAITFSGIRTLKKRMKLSRSLLYSIVLMAAGIMLEIAANK